MKPKAKASPRGGAHRSQAQLGSVALQLQDHMRVCVGVCSVCVCSQGRTATQRERLWLWLNVRRSGNAPE